MITLLYIYFVLNLIGGVVALILPSTPIWDRAISALKSLDNSEIATHVHKRATHSIIVTIIMLILMIIFF